MAVTAETFRLLRSQQGELNDLIATLDGRVQAAWYSIRADLDTTSWASLTPAQRRNLAATMDTQWGRKLETIAGNTKSAAQAAAAAAWAHQEELANTQAPTKLHFRRPDPQAEAWMNQRTSARIESRTRALSNRARVAMYTTLNQGVQQGLNPQDVARRAVRMAARLADTIDGGIARALTIARTEVLDSYRESSMLTQKANADVLDGWIWVAKLGAHTCRSCWAKHGTVYPVDQPGPGDHPQGRCARVPKTKSWSDLGFEGIEEVDDVGLDAVKAFKKMTDDQQRMVLGEEGWKLWKNGQWPRARWAVEEKPADWRPFFRAAKVPRVSPKPPVVPPKPVKPPAPPKPAPTPEKPPVVTKPKPKPGADPWRAEWEQARGAFDYGNPGSLRSSMNHVGSPNYDKYSQTPSYFGALDGDGNLVPLYRDNLEAVKRAGKALDDEWRARVQADLGHKGTVEFEELDQAWVAGQDIQWGLNARIQTLEREMNVLYMNRPPDLLEQVNAITKKLDPLMDERDAARLRNAHLKSDRQDILDEWKRNADAMGLNMREYRELIEKTEGKHLHAILDELGKKTGQNVMNWRLGYNQPAKLVEEMEKAERCYPEEWLNRAKRKNSVVDLAQERRGYNSAGGKKIVLSPSLTGGPGDVLAVAVHELGHSMEYVVDGLAQMEWAYLYDRASTVRKGLRTWDRQTAIYKGTQEKGWKDDWKLHYTGKEYDGSAWEVFTTGIESLWGNSKYLDKDFRGWLLGVLSVL